MKVHGSQVRRGSRVIEQGLSAGLLVGAQACVFHPPPPLAGEALAPDGPRAGEPGEGVAKTAPGDGAGQGEQGAPEYAAGEAPDVVPNLAPNLGMNAEEIRAYATAQGDPKQGEFTLDEALDGLPGEGALWADIIMDRGTLSCELFPELAPLTVANFVGLARGLRPTRDPNTGAWAAKPYYDGTEFHRVIMGFMIQGGDPTGTGMGEAGYVLPEEFTPKLRHDRPGMLSMANRGPTTGSAQFFITLAPTPHLDDKHTIFGRCTDASVRLAEDIAVTGGTDNRPATPQVIERVEIRREPTVPGA